MGINTLNLRQIAESNSDAILVLAESNKIIFMNAAANELFKNDENTLKTACAQLELVNHKADLEFIGDNWEMLFLTAYIASVFWEGKKVRWITLKNRTPQIKAIAEKNKMIEALELKRAEMELFAFIILHDIRAPIMAIRSFINCLEDSIRLSNTKMIQQDLDLVKMSVWNMDDRLDQLSQAGKLNDIHEDFEKVDLNEVVTEALKEEQLEIIASNIDVTIQGAPLPMAYGNKKRFIQLFKLLINNAAKFMGNQKSPKINILHKLVEKKHVFAIQDNGAGIDVDKLSKVFDAFYKVNEKTEGSGLGLSLAQTIVGMYKGDIWADSAGRGYGATFAFTLPLALKMSEIKAFSEEKHMKDEVAAGKFMNDKNSL